MSPVQAIAARELLTVARSRATLVLFAGVLFVVFGIAITGDEPHYLSTAVDLLLPMELLVPAVAVALGYRTVVDDARRGELEVLETYPVTYWQYVCGVYLGRGIALVVVLCLPLVLVGVYVTTSSPEPIPTVATHTGVDSPVVFARFITLTIGFGLTILAVSIAVSAIARSRRSALVYAVVALAMVVLVLDLLVVRGFTGGLVPTDQLTSVLAISPTSAYRGLAFETVVSPAIETDLQQASPLLNVASLAVWTLGSLGVASLAITRR